MHTMFFDSSLNQSMMSVVNEAGSPYAVKHGDDDDCENVHRPRFIVRNF